METQTLIMQILLGCLGAVTVGLSSLALLMMKWMRDDMKEIKDDIKDVKKILESHGNRLTAIETGLHMFEWFQTKGPRLKARGEDDNT